MSAPNGSSKAEKNDSGAPPATPDLSAVVGINVGNTYASIAVINKEGLAECIANEDGERQIACCVSFHGEETYIGNQAKQHLVKNASNTIIGFRNLLGKKFSEIKQPEYNVSAPVIEHPEQPNVAAYKVRVLLPSPSPIPSPTPTPTPSTAFQRSAFASPMASHLATPRSEPIPVDRYLTVSEVTTLFLKSLIQSAQAYLGQPVAGAVLAVPVWFDSGAREALKKAAEDAGINVLQLLDEIGAGVAVTLSEPGSPDRTALIVDVGQSSTTLSVINTHQGLATTLGTSHTPNLGADQIDTKLVQYFAKEFTKKTKTPLVVCPAQSEVDKRAEAKLRLAIEHTKRTVSASPGAATCSVESLKDGMDFAGTINRLRFDMEVRTVYTAICNAAKSLLESINLDPSNVDELVYVGGTASFPGLDTAFASVFPESVSTPFTNGTIVGGGSGDPTTILARGCVVQAVVIMSIPEEDKDLKAAFMSGEHMSAKATSKSIGIVFPEDADDDDEEEKEGMGGLWVKCVPKGCPFPHRRVIQLDAALAKGSETKAVGFEVWEVNESIKVDKVKPPKEDLGDDDELDEEEEEIEVKEKVVEKDSFLGSLRLASKFAKQEKGRWKTKLAVQFVLNGDGVLNVTAWEEGPNGKGEESSFVVGHAGL